MITVHTKSYNWCIGTKSQYRQANLLKSLSAWDLSGWFLHGICMKLMACLKCTHHGTASHRCCTPRLQATSQFLLSTAPMHWRDAPWVLQHSAAHAYCALALTPLYKGPCTTHRPAESGHFTLCSQCCMVCSALNSLYLCAKGKFERTKAMIQRRRRSPVQNKGVLPSFKMQFLAVQAV